MLNNWVNIGDVFRVAEKLRQGYLNRILGSLRPKSADRVRSAWGDTSSPPRHWGSVPQVVAHWNRLISGDESLRHYGWVAQTHFPAGQELVGLSVGCGSGANELRWAHTGAFSRIDAFDLSEERISEAHEDAVAAGFDHVVKFDQADMSAIEFEPDTYDVVIAENSLHHFSPVRPAIAKLHRSLKPGGLLILRDYVGPLRFQWTDRQLEAVDGLLFVLPTRYRRRWRSNTIKSRHYRPSRLSMLVSDPSEAAESDQTLGILSELFDVVQFVELGGTLVHLVLNDIAHNFLDDSAETAAWLDHLIRTERLLLESGDITSDFVFGVYRKSAAAH